MELEEQYLYAKRNRISFLNLQFSTFVFGQDLGDQNAYYYGPGLQVFPLGLLLPKLNSLFSSGISYNLPLTGEQTSGINSQNVKLYARIFIPIKTLAIGLERSSLGSNLFSNRNNSTHIFIGLGRDAYTNPISFKAFYRISSWNRNSIFDGFSEPSNFQFLLSINLLNIGNGMKKYQREIKIVAKQKRSTDKKYIEASKKFGLD
ncbi:MAG: hypothetical protein AAFY41_10865 [Bacteroidota bacterium]